MLLSDETAHVCLHGRRTSLRLSLLTSISFNLTYFPLSGSYSKGQESEERSRRIITWRGLGPVMRCGSGRGGGGGGGGITGVTWGAPARSGSCWSPEARMDEGEEPRRVSAT